ncbi:MAG: DUF5752 family protein [Desulfobacteraceae bacterium]|nr:DUF5752 family protein [Desulfobacteraceae bacterium]
MRKTSEYSNDGEDKMTTHSDIGPFLMKDCALVTIATGRRAQNLREMRGHLLNVHLGSVYHHFWGGLLRPRFDEPQYKNDFAEWVYRALHDNILAEQLSVIDPDRYDDLKSLRQDVLEVIDDRLDALETVPWAAPDMQFHFLRSQIVVFDTHVKVEHPEQLLEAVPNMSVGSTFYHIIDARRRSPEMMDDFRTWLRAHGEDELCRKIATIDPYFSTLVELRKGLADLLTRHFRVE